MNAYMKPRQSAFAQRESTSLPAKEIDIDRLVWDREYRDEIQGKLKNADSRLS